MSHIHLNQALDTAALRTAYAEHGRVQIHNFLAEDAASTLARELATNQAWRLTFNDGDKVVDHTRDSYARLSEEQRAAMARGIVDRGRKGFQFCYDVIRDDAGASDADDGPLTRFVRFLNETSVLEKIREITGARAIARVDGHASRYTAGQFLTTHDDRIEGRGRRAAYVLNLSPLWHPDWGGILQFFDGHGNVTRGYTPAFNTLNLFAVPQPHSVTWVTPLATAPRLSITGWVLEPATTD